MSRPKERRVLAVKLPPKKVTDRCLKCDALTDCCTVGVERLAKELQKKIAGLKVQLAAVKKCHRRKKSR